MRMTPEQVTNYSLATRRAWVTDPDRAVGRRKGTKLTDRVSVTLRFDREGIAGDNLPQLLGGLNEVIDS